MRQCTKCLTEKDDEEFLFRNKSAGTRKNTCKVCHSEYAKNHYVANKEDYQKRNSSTSSYVKQQKIRNKKNVLEYLSNHPCVTCGESDPVVLEFDHLKDKKYQISTLLCGGYSWETILKEIEKCQVLCANCHRRKTAKDFNWYKQ